MKYLTKVMSIDAQSQRQTLSRPVIAASATRSRAPVSNIKIAPEMSPGRVIQIWEAKAKQRMASGWVQGARDAQAVADRVRANHRPVKAY